MELRGEDSAGKLACEMGILTFKNNFEWIYVRTLSTAHAVRVSDKILLILMHCSVHAR